jgi:hypothetical protein
MRRKRGTAVVKPGRRSALRNGAGLALALGIALLVLPAWAAADDPPWEVAPPAPGAPPAAPPAAPDSAAPDSAAQPAPAKEPVDPAKAPKCIVTGERWDTSSTRVEAIFRVDGEKQRGKFLGLPFMLIEYQLLKDQHHDVDIVQVSVLDYPTFGTDHEQMIIINDDWSNVAFVSTAKKLPGSKTPCFAAFSSADDLDGARKELNGKVLTYKSVLEYLFKALKAEEE